MRTRGLNHFKSLLGACLLSASLLNGIAIESASAAEENISVEAEETDYDLLIETAIYDALLPVLILKELHDQCHESWCKDHRERCEMWVRLVSSDNYLSLLPERRSRQ